MPAEEHKALLRRVLEEIYAKGHLELADELVHPEFVDHEHAHSDLPTGPESVKRTVRHLHDVFGDIAYEVEDEIAEGDKLVQRVRMSGRHTGTIMGVEASGREFGVRHVYIWRIVDGMLAEHWGARDDLGLLQQIGVLPE